MDRWNGHVLNRKTDEISRFRAFIARINNTLRLLSIPWRIDDGPAYRGDDLRWRHTGTGDTTLEVPRVIQTALGNINFPQHEFHGPHNKKNKAKKLRAKNSKLVADVLTIPVPRFDAASLTKEMKEKRAEKAVPQAKKHAAPAIEKILTAFGERWTVEIGGVMRYYGTYAEARENLDRETGRAASTSKKRKADEMAKPGLDEPFYGEAPKKKAKVSSKKRKNIKGGL